MSRFYYFWKIWLWINQLEKEFLRNPFAEIPSRNNIKTNNVVSMPIISGDLTKEPTNLNSEEYFCDVNFTSTPEMKNIIKLIGVNIMGIKDTLSYISKITDVTTAEIDSILSRNSNIIIEGKDIINISEKVIENKTDKIVLRLPSNIDKDKYELVIHTYVYPEKSEVTT